MAAVDLQCQGVDMKLTEQQMTHMKECAESVGAKDKSELTIEKFPVGSPLFSISCIDFMKS